MESVFLNYAVLVSILVHVSCQFLVMTEMSFLEQLDFQKRFLKYPSSSVDGAAIQNRGKAHPSGTRNSRGLTGNVGHFTTVRCLRIVKFLLFIQGIHLVLQGPDLRQELIQRRRFFFLLSIKLICFNCRALSVSSRLFSVIPQFPSNQVHDSLDKVYFSP